MKGKKISVIEMPLDFGASRHGSDMGPSAIRLAGLGNKLEDLGYDIVKYDCPIQINPKEYEEQLYQEWEEKGYFKPSMDKTKESYCIMMPPPNVTGKLHMGHALDGTLQDILIRFKRMQGFNTLWLPGTDHAAIATEVKVVEKMKKRGCHIWQDRKSRKRIKKELIYNKNQ